MVRYIFITGGVVSSLGKGVASAILGALLQAAGYSVRLRKLDPYLNVDPGTMSPYQHGEVFVTDDGAETDLDLGHYERFTGVDARRGDNVTAGQIYSDLLARERRGEYLGGTVQVIPHVTDLIKDFIRSDNGNADFVLCEIGGTVGDIEAQPFCEAIRQLGYELGRELCLFMHLTLVPYIPTANELKTKPTQHSVKEMRSIGIQPNILLCRSQKLLPKEERAKIALFCNVNKEDVIQALDQKSIYHALLAYNKEGLTKRVLHHFNLPMTGEDFNIEKWHGIVEKYDNPLSTVKIAIVGKYTKFKDSYKSLIEALIHGGLFHNCKVKIVWADASEIDRTTIAKILQDVDGILVPGGFGARDTEGKLEAIRYARINNIPFLGICLGMQLAAIEFARNVIGIENASSTEFTEECTPIICMMDQWNNNGVVINRNSKQMGGTMRLGAYECDIEPDTLARKIYGQTRISERHRHRYEFNISFEKEFLNHGIKLSGRSPDGKLVEIIEMPAHKWFVAVQFHPELKSRAFAPHPLFVNFIGAANHDTAE